MINKITGHSIWGDKKIVADGLKHVIAVLDTVAPSPGVDRAKRHATDLLTLIRCGAWVPSNVMFETDDKADPKHGR